MQAAAAAIWRGRMRRVGALLGELVMTVHKSIAPTQTTSRADPAFLYHPPCPCLEVVLEALI